MIDAEFNRAVHPDDFMARYQLTVPGNTLTAEENLKGYFAGGAADAQTFADVIHNVLGFAKGRGFSLLEFAAGYGRVSRHLAARFPKAAIETSDIHPAAVQFLSGELGMPSHQSSSVPEQLQITGKYDVIFCLSFFTHMPPDTFGRWLSALHRRLNPGGFLIFTTAGRKAYGYDGRDITQFDGKHAIFRTQSEQADLNTTEYGGMFVTPGYVISQLWEHVRAPIVFFGENYWWECQDLWIVTKL